MKDIRVIGVGNTLLGDDGIGSLISRDLDKEELPAGVHVLDAGCALSEVLLGQTDADILLLVDAVKGGGSPGDVYRFGAEILDSKVKMKGPYVSVHEFGLVDAITLARLTWEKMPEIYVIGIEPASMDTALEISAPLREKYDKIYQYVLGVIHELAEEDS